MHTFILQPGTWKGEGRVTFSNSDAQLDFTTKWVVKPLAKKIIASTQEVMVEGNEEPLENFFQIYDITDKSFNIILKNAFLNEVQGIGIIDYKTIAWEFRGEIGFQGFEVYENEGDNQYKFHAEYASPDQFRTIIDGFIWKGKNKS